MFGIINVYKEKGITSFDVVAKLRKILGQKKIGHTGTLDPNATGVLPICIGNATKLSQYILNEDKEYIATMKLGIKTDTEDITGKVLETKEVKRLNIKDIEDVCKSFIGKQQQIPPMYSAAKVNGKKLYQLARMGIEIERKPKDIEIYDISNIKYNSKDNILILNISCSKGTFIRTLCLDIAKKLGTISTLKDLERVKTGRFTIDNSYKLEEIENIFKNNKMDNILYNIEDLFDYYDNIEIKEEAFSKLLNGVELSTKLDNGIYKLYYKEKFIGLGNVQNNKLKREYILENV